MGRDMDIDKDLDMDKDISSNSEINNTSFIKFENSNDSCKKTVLSCDENNYNTQTFSAFKGNENSFPINYQSKNDSSEDEMTNPD